MLSSNINLGSGADVLITSTLHNNGGIANAGAMILAADVLVSPGNFERGRVMGTSAGELLGSDGFQFLTNGNYVIFSEGKDSGGFTDNGSVILVNRVTGNAIGRFDGPQHERDPRQQHQIIEAPNGNYWAPSPLADPGGTMDAGTLYLLSGTTGLLVRPARRRHDQRAAVRDDHPELQPRRQHSRARAGARRQRRPRRARRRDGSRRRGDRGRVRHRGSAG